MSKPYRLFTRLGMAIYTFLTVWWIK